MHKKMDLFVCCYLLPIPHAYLIVFICTRMFKFKKKFFLKKITQMEDLRSLLIWKEKNLSNVLPESQKFTEV